jgi:hypothetical protein
VVDSGKIKRSDDGGSTWALDTELNDRLTVQNAFGSACGGSRCAFNDLVVDRSDPKKRFALGMAGVFYTTDGSQWFRLLDTAALPSRPVSGYYDRISDPKTPSLYVACDGRGVLRIYPVP